jgi:putative membrane-bound dehydrogenase-like protein
MTVPDGFRVTLFAGEPDVVQPIAMATDERGRLWVVESLTYPTWIAKNAAGSDRVTIFEDGNGDGRFDSKKVFLQNGRNLSGIALGFDGVWLCSAPELIFVPDRNRDDSPDGPPEVLLDGWTLEAKHNIVNGLTWGPDGWLYGCHGILADSHLGRPGTPPNARTKINCGVWRFHPTRQTFEVVAHGTTNPWGIAFNEHGQMFIANCVIKHLFHVIPGARYERMYGQDDNPYAFRLIESCADHIHWAGGWWKTEGAQHPQNETAGGGHAHCGAMIYLGDNWPERYRDTFFTLNIHGHRINNDALERRGSGYVARHGPDFLKANDDWFRGVSLVPAADGGVFVSDWTDAGECHDYIDIHRENGRIYKVTYGTPATRAADLAARPDLDLVRLQTHQNDWFASTARRLLQERAMEGKLDRGARAALVDLLRENSGTTPALRALWALHVTGNLDEAQSLECLRNQRDATVRGWAVRSAAEKGALSDSLRAEFERLARTDPSPVVRLELAAALQRFPVPERLPLAEALTAHREDAEDPNIPLMLWYAIEPIVSTDDRAAGQLLTHAQIPLVRQFIAQRLALRMALDPVAKAIVDSTEAGLQRDLAQGVFEALNGRRELNPPPQWAIASRKLGQHSDAAVREKALLLSLIFGDANAMSALRERAANPGEAISARQNALQALVQARDAKVVPLMQRLIDDRPMRGVVIRGLAAFEDAATPRIILQNYAAFTAEEKAEAITTLSSRPNYGVALLEGVKQGRVPARDISPFTARQLQAFKEAGLPALVRSVLGEVRSIAQNKTVLIDQHKKLLTPSALGKADRSRGRALFNRTCAACHVLFGEGGQIAPELTGSQRSNLDYILENVVDPNAVVWDRYRATYFESADDRLITGIVLQENEGTVTIQTQTGTVTLPQKEIVSRQQSALSMMPEGLLEGLQPDEVIDLISYLQSPAQVPLPK